ncbi:MAG: TIGR00300 family protein, partial [Planctomycetes bacterium]|nr:TIGR00300 family protein [Planctomycetota bacterium]
MHQETVTLEGHIIDSDVLRRVFARIVEGGGSFEVLDFTIGRTNEEASRARMTVRSESAAGLDAILEGIRYLGATATLSDVLHLPAEADGILPDEFYSTSNFETFVRVDGHWLIVKDQKMDCAIVLEDGEARCMKQRMVRKDDAVVLRGSGIRVRPPERDRNRSGFSFMSNDVSAEVNKSIAIRGTAKAMHEARAAGEKIVVVTGPAVVHSGGDVALGRLVRDGWIDVILSGNAFAVHDL